MSKIWFYLSFVSVSRTKRRRSESPDASSVSVMSNTSMDLPIVFNDGPVTSDPPLV